MSLDPVVNHRDAEPLVRAVAQSAEAVSVPAAGPVANLELWLTGTGNPVVLPDRAGPSNLLRVGDDLIAVDCGNGFTYQIARLGFDPRALRYVFITHHHVDHNADLGFLLLSSWSQLRKGPYTPPVIVGPTGTLAFVDRTLHAQEYDIRVRIPHGADPNALVTRVVEVDDCTVVRGRGWTATAFRVDHGPVDEAFGYRFDVADTSAVISGDTRPCDNLVSHAEGADVLVHEVLYPGFGIAEYHTLSTDVGKIAARAGVGHLVLTHLIPGHLDDQAWIEHVRADFDGQLTVGHDLMKIL